MSVEESDLKLVEKVQRGERAAFDLLVLRYQHKVLKLIMRYVHDATEAEDIAQEAFRQLLDTQDQVLYAYCLGVQPPPPHLATLIERITANQ